MDTDFTGPKDFIDKFDAKKPDTIPDCEKNIKYRVPHDKLFQYSHSAKIAAKEHHQLSETDATIGQVGK